LVNSFVHSHSFGLVDAQGHFGRVVGAVLLLRQRFHFHLARPTLRLLDGVAELLASSLVQEKEDNNGGRNRQRGKRVDNLRNSKYLFN
jgi:hypothetical protein